MSRDGESARGLVSDRFGSGQTQTMRTRRLIPGIILSVSSGLRPRERFPIGRRLPASSTRRPRHTSSRFPTGSSWRCPVHRRCRSRGDCGVGAICGMAAARAAATTCGPRPTVAPSAGAFQALQRTPPHNGNTLYCRNTSAVPHDRYRCRQRCFQRPRPGALDTRSPFVAGGVLNESPRSS
jgi:hypothetical protein